MGNRGECRSQAVSLVQGVRYGPGEKEDLLRQALPLERDETERLRGFKSRFTELCDELAAHDVPETVQHDDLHMANVYADGGQLLVLDWGDSSISHPFGSLVVTFRFLEEINGLPPGDPWFARLRDAYLEPWGRGRAGTFALALRVGTFAHLRLGASARPSSGRHLSSTRCLRSCSGAH